jgi:O-antigen/teichoic acid export membrane protein
MTDPDPTPAQPPPGTRLRRRIVELAAAVRSDNLTRSSVLLVLDNLIIGAIGGICAILAAREWSPHAVGAVAAIGGVVLLLSAATSTGLASTITRFLGEEHNQLDLVLEAMLFTVVFGLALSGAVCFLPGHLGVPLHDLPVTNGVAFLLIGGWVSANNVVAVTDPAFLARKEVSYAVAKDILSSVIRVAVLVALIGTATTGLFLAGMIYGSIAAILDLFLIAWRLRNSAVRIPLRRLSLIRRRLRFAVGSHSGALVSTIPSTLLATIVAAIFNATTAAFVAVPLVVASYVSIIPSLSSQALLAELTGSSDEVSRIALRTLRLSYLGVLPLAGFLALFAPFVMLIFGHRYEIHGTWYLRWALAGTIFSTFNYVSDIVLLARQKVVAYNVVNALGTVAVLGTVIGFSTLGARWIGPAILAGEILYSTLSLIAIARYTDLSEMARAVRGLRSGR